MPRGSREMWNNESARVNREQRRKSADQSSSSGRCVYVARARGNSIAIAMTGANNCNSQFIELGSVNDAATDSVDAKCILRKGTARRVKSVAGHVGLLIALMLYTVIGGLVSLQFSKPKKSETEGTSRRARDKSLNKKKIR